MGKIDAQSQARMDGMAYALRIAKKEGVEGLDKELKRRGITGLGLPASHKEIDHELDKIKMQVLDTVLAMSCLVLRDEFGFGEKRLKKIQGTVCAENRMSARWTLYMGRCFGDSQRRNRDRTVD